MSKYIKLTKIANRFLALTSILLLSLLAEAVANPLIAHHTWKVKCELISAGAIRSENNITLKNYEPTGEIPKAGIILDWVYESCVSGISHKHGSEKPHSLIYSECDVIIDSPEGREVVNPGAINGPVAFGVNAFQHGWKGSVSFTIQHRASGIMLEYLTAEWDFEKPDCKTCVGGACRHDSKIKSIDVTIPLGDVTFGNGTNQLRFKNDTLANPGIAALEFEGTLISGISELYNNTTNTELTGVLTDNSLATLAHSPSLEDPNRFEISFSFLEDLDLVYRKITVEMVNGELLVTEEAEGRARTSLYSKPDPAVWTLIHDGRRRTTRTDLVNEAQLNVRHHLIEEKSDLDNEWQVVSSLIEHRKLFTWGWETIKEIVDPEGSALVTEYDYHETENGIPGTLPSRAFGRIKSEKFPTGHTRHYEYHPYNADYTSIDTVTEHFADAADAKVTRIHRKTNGDLVTTLEEVLIGGIQVSKKIVSGSSTLRTESVYITANGPPTVTTTDSYTNLITYPDGTVERSTSATDGNILTHTVERGIKNSGTTPYLSFGTVTEQKLRRSGLEQSSKRMRVQNGTVFRMEESVVVAMDHLERPTLVNVYHGNNTGPTYARHMNYSCCGLSQETGQDGITRHFFRDALNRVVKTHFNGISEETRRHGLVEYSHRYPESLAGPQSGADASNLVSTTTTNLAGDTVFREERSPKDGTLLTTAISTAYQPEPGVGKRVVTTYPLTADDNNVAPVSIQEYYPDGRLKAVLGQMSVNMLYSYSASSTGLVVTVANRASNGALFGAEISQQDFSGQVVSVELAGDKNGDNEPDRQLMSYDQSGRIKSSVDPDGVTTLYAYDVAAGTRTVAVDMNGNGMIDIGADRVLVVTEGVGTDASGKTIEWSETKVRTSDARGQSVWQTVTRTEQTPDGLHAKATQYAGANTATSASSTTYLPNQAAAWDTVQTAPDGTYSITQYRSGRLDSRQQYNAEGQLLFSTAHSYDDYQRLESLTDSRMEMATTYGYVSPLVDVVSSVTQGSRVTTYSHDERGRQVSVNAPDTIDAGGNPVTNVTTTTYWPSGLVKETSGTPGYRQSFTYNDAGQMETLTTYGNTTAVTRWEYDADRGWLLGKRYNSPQPGQGSGESYIYTAGGKLKTRTLARGVSSQYSYDAAGSLLGIDYSDNTPDVAILERDQLGRVRRISDAAGERNLRYDDWGGHVAVSFGANSAVPGWEITSSRDQIGRLASLGVAKAGTGLDEFRIFHHYDQAGRLESIASGGASAHYGYEGTHQALRQIAISVNDTPVLYGNLQYDSFLQLRRISYHNGDLQGTLKAYSDFQFALNDLGNITSVTLKDRSKQLVGYNSAGEVVKTEHLLDAAGTDRRRGGNFAWSYDGIGNLLSAARGGDSTGANLRATSYTPNALNQYDSITHPGAVDVTGRAPAADTVTVNSAPANRQGERFHREVTADNSGGSVWKEILVGNGTANLDGFSLIPPATRTPVHDADGNLTHDGVYQYTWDAENRLIKIETLAAAVTAGVPYRRVEYLYDSSWRRVQRQRYDQPTGAVVEHTRYLWAGWRCLAEVDTSGELSKTFVWGLDSRQSLHLGDGNGALLWINDLAVAQRHFCHYDDNGNITGLSDASGVQTAEYLYNAFGELLERSGSYADKNLYRFSTKPFEEVGGLYYYGYRHLDAGQGRWLSQDPLGEMGGLNLRGFVENDGLNRFDALGFYPMEKFVGAATQFANDNVVPIFSGIGVAFAGSVMSGYSTMGPSAAAAAEFGGLSPWAVPAAGAASAVASRATEDVIANEAAYRRFKKECAEELYERRFTPVETYVEEALISAVVGEAFRRGGNFIQKLPLQKLFKNANAAKGTANANRIMGERAVDDFIAHAQTNGMEVVGREVTFGTPFGNRRLDVVLRNLETGSVGGVEIKSTTGAFNRFDRAARQQFSADRWINTHGADAVGQFEGLRIDNTLKMLWEAPR